MGHGAWGIEQRVIWLRRHEAFGRHLGLRPSFKIIQLNYRLTTNDSEAQ